MSERSLEVFKQYREAQQKYDYYIVGLSLALLAYMAKDFVVLPLGFNRSTIELVSNISLFVSVAAGLLRLEYYLIILSNNFKKLYNLETKGKLTEALLQPGPKINIETGEIFDPSLATLELETIEGCMPGIEKNLNKYQNFSEITFVVRNWALFIGVGLLVMSRALDAIQKTAF